MSKQKIILTGGGTAGHVTPNLALVPTLKELGYEVQYIGTKEGIERKLVKGEQLKYHSISSGKLRRYFDVKNFTDPFRVVKGVFEAINIIRKEKPNIVFSKGGFVAVPVVIGARLNRVPVIIHESDITPGLANKISIPYCKKVCVTFPEALKHFKENKALLTGTPIRAELFQGEKHKGLEFAELKGNKPVLLVIGGSLGSKILNKAIRDNLKVLLVKYQVIHICGKGHLDKEYTNIVGYKQFEYVDKQLPDIFAASDLIISRAGANAIFEFLALKKPNLLVPLSAKSSRGDQIDNAKSFKNSGYSMVLQEEELESSTIIEAINELYNNREKFIKTMSSTKLNDAIKNITNLIVKYSK